MAGIELGCPYFIYNPPATQYVAFNLPADPNFVGYINNVTGLDMAGVRENAEVVVAGDGGHHGPFWRDRRPWTLGGFIMPTFPILARDQAQEKLEGVMGACMRQDGYLFWNPADGIQKFINFRTQQPVRITTGQSAVQKDWNIACVTEDWRILANPAKTLTTTGIYQRQLTCVNIGNAEAAPLFTFTGPITFPTCFNQTTNKGIWFNGNIGAETVTVDLTGRYPSVTGSVSGDLSYLVRTDVTVWSVAVSSSQVTPGGSNLMILYSGGNNYGIPPSAGASCTFSVSWRDSWQ